MVQYQKELCFSDEVDSWSYETSAITSRPYMRAARSMAVKPSVPRR